MIYFLRKPKMQSQLRLQNRAVVITGGNSGIGFATAKKVIEEGGISIIVGRDKEKINSACTVLGANSVGFTCDISIVDEITLLFEKIERQFEMIYGVVANAGHSVLEPMEIVTAKSFDLSMNTNLKGAFFTVQKAVPLMKKGGSIVLNASLAAYRTFENAAIYSATKAALVSLAATLALELAKLNIRVNSVSPGTVLTPLFNKLGMTEEEIKDFILHYKQKISLERAGTPGEIANVISFLLSDESTFVTGTDILVDGGLANCIK